MAKRGATKKRIVDGARDAFNELRYGNVTTASLADRIGMSEGNLWYHFQTKRDLLAAIQGDFAEDTRATLDAVSPLEDPVQSYCDLLLAWRDLFSRYLFVFRDRGEYGHHSPDMIAAFPALYSALESKITEVFDGLIRIRKLAVDPQRVPDLVTNAILVTRYYFEFQEERFAATNRPAARSEEAMLRHITLFDGCLDTEVEQVVRRALRSK